MSTHHRPFKLAAESDALNNPFGQALSRQFASVDIRSRISPAEYINFGAADLILANHHGRFIKPCPGTKDYNCCGLEIIHIGLGCTLGCSYCILQGYLDSNALVLFGNIENVFNDLANQLAIPGARPRRFCTGEFTDSLLLEEITGTGARLVGLFARAAAGHTLELKTKTTNVRGLLELNHEGRTIVSFSVNAPEITRREERSAPALSARLKAARQVARAGYRLGFHFDPIIRYPGWGDGYAQTVKDIFDAVPSNQIAWISLGAFRYLPGMKDIVRRSDPKSRIMDEEFILAEDGKMRYLRPVRVEIYQRLLAEIRSAAPEVCVYLCMESPRVWREVFGYDPGTEGLIRMLDERTSG
ncbi:MAG: DNA photolyase [Deltaproteobacteria bacterium]|nr:DNA photolyase [Deltaproteobacteria bacterium]